jgi:hypothetical protein
MILVFAAWLPFYETRFDVLSHKLAILSSPSSYSFLLLRQFASSFDSWHYLPLTVLFILTLLTFLAEATSSRKKVFYGYANHPVAIVILITLTVWFGSTKGNDFIYFSF